MSMKEWKKELTRHVGYNLAVLLCMLLALFCAVMSLLSLFGMNRGGGIEVKERFEVSSSALDATYENNVAQISGYLVNSGNEKVVVDRVTVVVGDGKAREEIELEGFTLYPRLPQEVFFEWKTSFYFDYVHSVTVEHDGYAERIANSSADWEFNPNVMLYAVLCMISAFVGVFFAKKRFYRWQEDQMASRA